MDKNSLTESFLRLVSIMDDLREKCPWDKKQTIQTLRQLTIEETFELADAITEGDWKAIREELGDLMLHILFYSKIGNERQQFTLTEVMNGISEKLINRHPHIYKDVKVNDEEDVKRNWEKLKLMEGKKSVLSGVPKSLPALVKAMRLQEKAKQVGFEWENKDQVWEKVEEEIAELQLAISNKQLVNDNTKSGELQKEIELEFGDVLFSLINYARFLQIDPENALELTNKKFINRFTRMEENVNTGGGDISNMSLAELDAVWNKIKKQDK